MTGIKFKRRIGAKNQKLIVTLPDEIIEWIGLSVGQELTLQCEEGKHGRFFSVFVDNDTKTVE